MTRITPEELIYLLSEQDREATYLFVEGIRDVQFWRLVVPANERPHATVAPIGIIECAPVDGGERGRAIWLARVLEGSAVRDRVRFFLDADNDAVLPHDIPQSVILTDFRDLESYAANDNCFQALLYAHGRNPDDYAQFGDEIFGIGKTLGAARVANCLLGTCLSFNDAFLARPGTVLVVDGGRLTLDRARFLTRLFATTALTQDEADFFAAEVELLECGLADDDPRILLCGKDFAAILATHFKVHQQDAYRSIHQALAGEIGNVRALPKFAAAEAFCRA
jgi:hypothetical protein